MFLKRRYSDSIQTILTPGKVLVVYGPRQVGKTTLVRNFLDTYGGRFFSTTGEDAQTRAILGAMSQEKIRLNYGDLDLLFIDEAQAVNGIGKALKLLVDTLPDLNVIVTGSSSFELAGETGEPLVGRKRTLTLYPFSFDLKSAVQRRRHLAEARRRGVFEKFSMKLEFMQWTLRGISFTIWVKAVLYETAYITLKFSAPPRLRERYRLGSRNPCCGNCFF